MSSEKFPGSQHEELINLAAAVNELEQKVAKWETVIETAGGPPSNSERVILN